MTIKSFRVKGKQGAAHVIQNREGRLSVMAENADGFTDWPIRYPNGQIAWDHPERMPEYVKVLVRRAFRAIKSGAIQ